MITILREMTRNEALLRNGWEDVSFVALYGHVKSFGAKISPMR